MEGFFNLDPEQGIFTVLLRFVDIQLGRHHVKISYNGYRHFVRQQGFRPFRKAIEPFEFIVEFWHWGRIAIGQADARHDNSTYKGFEVLLCTSSLPLGNVRPISWISIPWLGWPHRSTASARARAQCSQHLKVLSLETFPAAP